ncbi:MAG TPA: hypothetical protein ENK49_00945 [Gammaproteobacteria bacterium]|nr:hypothetical protein [Gammaproteobacteria bacterium]
MRTDSLSKTGLLFMLMLLAQPFCPGASADTPDSQPGYDQVTAQIPLDLAPLGSVALARLNIALHNARQAAAARLCGGQWSPQGAVLFRQGPVVAQNPRQAVGTLSWHYTELRQAGTLSCAPHSRAAFFLEMSRHLPAWVQVRPAGQLTVFRQGEAIVPAQKAIALREADRPR